MKTSASMTTSTDCRTEEGITVGLIDALISVCRILAKRELESEAVIEALKDLRTDGDVLAVFPGAAGITFPCGHYRVRCSKCHVETSFDRLRSNLSFPHKPDCLRLLAIKKAADRVSNFPQIQVQVP